MRRSVISATRLVLAISLSGVWQTVLADAVTVVEGIKILDGKRAEAVFYYENNWAHFRREAVEQELVDSFELIVAGPDNDEPVDILLITRFRDPEQYAGIEDAYERIMDGRELRLLNDTVPGEFRRSAFVVQQGDTKKAD